MLFKQLFDRGCWAYTCFLADHITGSGNLRIAASILVATIRLRFTGTSREERYGHK